MNQQRDLPEPPRIAQWLTSLFAPADVAEAVTGDVQEEFASLVVSWGASRARTWYRQQALGIIVRSGPSAFRAHPFRMLIIVLGALWFTGFATTYSARAMQMLLDAHRVYELDPSGYLFWLKFPFEIGRIMICTVVGSLVALAAKRYELPTAVSLALAQIAMFGAGTITLIAYGRPWFQWFVAMAPWNAMCSTAIIAGAAIVRVYRSSETARESRA